MKEVLPLRDDNDVIRARHRGRQIATEVGFGSIDLTLVATAISEVARNVITYAGNGRVLFMKIRSGPRRGIEIVAEDEGPGIADLELALTDGFSTSRSFGMGLPGSRRIMDEFEIDTHVGRGTRVTMRKWLLR